MLERKSTVGVAAGSPIPHPRLIELIERRKLRVKIAKTVSRLIAALDALDSDPDLEPSLGYDAPGMAMDGEEDAGERGEVENEHGDSADMEPSLGAPVGDGDQRRWAQGSHRDMEDDTPADPEFTAMEETDA